MRDTRIRVLLSCRGHMGPRRTVELTRGESYGGLASVWSLQSWRGNLERPFYFPYRSLRNWALGHLGSQVMRSPSCCLPCVHSSSAPCWHGCLGDPGLAKAPVGVLDSSKQFPGGTVVGRCCLSGSPPTVHETQLFTQKCKV